MEVLAGKYQEKITGITECQCFYHIIINYNKYKKSIFVIIVFMHYSNIKALNI